ncbi:MAG: transcriptional repressor [Bacteroidia bacterium]
MSSVSQILRSHSLRVTDSRNAILEVFFQREVALSESEIESALLHNCDRVTIYRTLSTFLEKGIVHKVLDDAGAMKYALCPTDCLEGHDHHHDHIHFKCEVCGNTSCVEQVRIPAIQLPVGYKLTEVNVLLQGICPRCN